MNAVWSLWSKPLISGIGSTSINFKTYLLSWILSLELAKKHYNRTVLFTDDKGYEILISGLHLQFDEVSKSINKLSQVDPKWWALGKMVAYKELATPFVHLDNDVFLWNKLPSRCESAYIFAQNPEPFEDNRFNWYRPKEFENLLLGGIDTFIPKELIWYRKSSQNKQIAVCCGIFGGWGIDFIHYYASLVLDTVMCASNVSRLNLLPISSRHMALIEQYLLSACIEYQLSLPIQKFDKLSIEYLFDSPENANKEASTMGYTHLIASSKNNPVLMYKLEQRVKQDYPRNYANCINYLNSLSMN